MNPDRLSSEREQATGHPLRRAILGLLDADELTKREIRSRLDGDQSVPRLTYHLGVLDRARLVRSIGGVYQVFLQKRA